MPSPAVFLDRDGTLNVPPAEGDYVLTPEALELIPGVAEAAGRLKAAGFKLALITNQACIAKGLVDEATLAAMHDKLSRLMADSGAGLDGVYWCPHVDADDCQCRKPRPGMLLQAATELDIDLQKSYMVGDSMRDMQMARAVGTQTVFVADHAYPGAAESALEFGPTISAGTVVDAVPSILADAKARGIL